ncbi:MAG TPA: hypothetical protein VFB99_12260 [Vicinamibacterales bacterium]|nr:hypothetical protein [Vicinamibacterales bacterium]
MQRFFIVVAAVVTVASTAVLSNESARDVAQYTFAVANAPKDVFSSDGRLRLRLLRWSSDDERRQVMAALEEPSTLLSALPYVGVAGYLQWPGGLEHTVRYARHTARPDGGADIVLVVERPLWLWWDPTAKWAADHQFTVVHMRVNKDGTGEGRIATGDGFRRDADSGITVSDTTKPALLTNVRRESVK